MGGAFWWLFTQLDVWIPTLMSYVPDWLQWLSYLLWPLAVISVLLVFGYFFSTIANWIAAPFNGLLAEQLEARLTGATPPDTGIFGIMKDVPRIMKREWQKFAWYLPRAIVLLILYFIPGIGQTVAPVLWFLFSAWMLAIQYCDYPFDNHKVPFKEMRTALMNHEEIDGRKLVGRNGERYTNNLRISPETLGLEFVQYRRPEQAQEMAQAPAPSEQVREEEAYHIPDGPTANRAGQSIGM